MTYPQTNESKKLQIKEDVIMLETVERKFEVTKEKMVIEDCKGNEVTLYRIRSLKDFSDVKFGTCGGFVASEECLSQDGDCWISEGCAVFEGCKVTDNARLSKSITLENNTTVSGNATIDGNAYLDQCTISDDVSIHGRWLMNNTELSEKARVFGRGIIDGANIGSDNEIRGYTVIRPAN